MHTMLSGSKEISAFLLKAPDKKEKTTSLVEVNDQAGDIVGSLDGAGEVESGVLCTELTTQVCFVWLISS